VWKKGEKKRGIGRCGLGDEAGITESCMSRAGSVVKKKEKRGVGR
jgi:hypothetical protein